MKLAKKITIYHHPGIKKNIVMSKIWKKAYKCKNKKGIMILFDNMVKGSNGWDMSQKVRNYEFSLRPFTGAKV